MEEDGEELYWIVVGSECWSCHRLVNETSVVAAGGL